MNKKKFKLITFNKKQKANFLSKNDIDVYPIFIKGLFGSFYSRASKKIQRNKNVLKRRRPVFIAFGHKIEHEKANKSNLKQEISKLSVKAWDEHLKTF